MSDSGGSPTFSFPVRVYYEDTDAAGVVYYANYLKFFERARTEWLRELRLDQTELAAEAGVIFVVRNANVQYRKPARLDDALIIRSQITRLRPASLEFSQWCVHNDDILVSALIQIGCVERTHLRPTAMPDRMRQQLQPLAASHPSTTRARAPSTINPGQNAHRLVEAHNSRPPDAG